MSSAAEKAFATPELLEKILLSTLDIEAEQTPLKIPGKHLFPCRRVSKAFISTMATSIHLKRAMQLEYRAEPAPSLAVVPEVLLIQKLLKQSAFVCETFSFGHVMSPSLGYMQLYFRAAWDETSKGELTFTWEKSSTAESELKSGVQPSWHAMKLRRYKLPVELIARAMDIQFREIEYRNESLETGGGTFGELLDLLKRDSDRIVAQHEAQTVRSG